jgi:hypothetical protein
LGKVRELDMPRVTRGDLRRALPGFAAECSGVVCRTSLLSQAGIAKGGNHTGE